MKQKGFTLIELMITVVIISILAAIAYPSYQDSVRQTRRAAAQADLMELASHMERLYTANSSYLSASGALPSMDNDFYSFDFSVGPTQSSYTLEADPAGTAQASDSCGALTLSHTGVQGAATSDCW